MDISFPEIKITTKGVGKEKQIDKDFFKELNVIVEDLIKKVKLDFLEEEKWLKSQWDSYPKGFLPIEQDKHRFSPFYNDHFVPAYTHASSIVDGYPVSAPTIVDFRGY
ncbi:hypothetical protein [Paenibacillus gansuensis]|uniref:Uncharacterized protein n=1 Tax=Paenibacillus gansuensis TaxID=306542 RepID=A0ABW5PGZ7_9BACL